MNTKVLVLVLAAVALAFFVIVGLAVRPQGSSSPGDQGGFEAFYDRLAGHRTLKPSDVAGAAPCVRTGGRELEAGPGPCRVAVPKGVRQVKLAVRSGPVRRVALRNAETVDQAPKPRNGATFAVGEAITLRVIESGSTLEVGCSGPCVVGLEG